MAQMLGGGTSAEAARRRRRRRRRWPAPKAAASAVDDGDVTTCRTSRAWRRLRPLTFDATSILAYQQISRSEINTAGETERAESLELDAPSLHYLLWHLRDR